mgnify:CR=1 FL=1
MKRFELSEMRYIDTMANFIIDSSTSSQSLESYIKQLSQIYQKNGEKELVNLRESLTENYEPKWTIQKEVKPSVLNSTQVKNKQPENTLEEIEDLLNEPSIRPNFSSKKKATTEEGSTQLTSFPAKAGAVEANVNSKESISKVRKEPKSNSAAAINETSSSLRSNVNEQNHQISDHYQQETSQHAVSKKKTTTNTDNGETLYRCLIEL